MASSSPPTVSELLRHQSWLKGLARDLTTDGAAADDVVQQTWLSALRTPPREAGAVRGWLRRVAKRHAWESHRADTRRERRETLAAARQGPSPSAADLAIRAEIQERVIHEVLALDEPFRSTVLLRFFEELPPREVARRLGVPVETVRSRLRRGLAQIRGRLEARDDGRGTWRPVLSRTQHAAASRKSGIDGLARRSIGIRSRSGRLSEVSLLTVDILPLRPGEMREFPVILNGWSVGRPQCANTHGSPDFGVAGDRPG